MCIEIQLCGYNREFMVVGLNSLFSALFAGIVAIAVTVAIERLGGIKGGILGTMPSTIVPAAIGIWLATNMNAVDFREAMGVVPLGLILNAGFLWLWRVIPDYIPNFKLSLKLTLIASLSLSIWFFAAIISIIFSENMLKRGVNPLILGLIGQIIGIIIGILACLKPIEAPKGKHEVGKIVLITRGLAAGCAIGIAVQLAEIGNPLASGVASIFPAIFTTSMIALWFSQGRAVPAGAIGPMMLGAMSVSSCALFYALLFPIMAVNLLGLISATILGWVLSVIIITIPSWYWLSSKRPILA